MMMLNKLFFVSLGCDKNRVDSEEMLGLLTGSGFSIIDNEFEADVIVINTCCFIDEAKEESIEAILQYADCKIHGKCKKLVVAGCLSERYKDEILVELPEVDAWIGTTDLTQILKACQTEVTAKGIKYPENVLQIRGINRVITTGGHFEFLKIAEGCGKHCTYCIIPTIRGKYHSYDIDVLEKEAEYLASQGVKELIVVAQETSIYGVDLYGKECLPDLLKRLCRIDGFEWIRVMYCYPEDITENFLEVLSSEAKICKYIDMPIQHIADSILKKMARRCSSDSIYRAIERVRTAVPDIAIRTSLISGFPGETEEDHIKLKNFIKESRLNHVGVFTYSREEGTPAASFTNQIEEDIKINRKNELMEIQEQVSSSILSSYIGKKFRVFVEGELPEEDVFIARTYMDAPDVDGYFYLKSNNVLYTGDFVDVIAEQNGAYDLFGYEIY